MREIAYLASAFVRVMLAELTKVLLVLKRISATPLDRKFTLRLLELDLEALVVSEFTFVRFKFFVNLVNFLSNLSSTLWTRSLATDVDSKILFVIATSSFSVDVGT